MRSAMTFTGVLLVGALFFGCGRERAQLSVEPNEAPEPVAEAATAAEIRPAARAASAAEIRPAAEAASAAEIRPAAEAGDCSESSLHCGATPSLRFDESGRLWAAFEQAGTVYVTTSDDLGETFRPAVPVNGEPERIETNGENRPKIGLGPDGQIYLSWTMKVEGRFKGDIRFSRSLDGGLSFEPPRTINDDGLLIGHRFDSLHVDPAGHVYLVWIDKRDLEAARSRGEAFRGASVYYTVSTDGGASFAPNRRVAEHACECCRIAIADGPAGSADRGAAVLWRHIFDANIRDHAFAILPSEGGAKALLRPSDDGWAIDACPHHGPAMVAAGGSGYHLTWFTAAADRPAVYYGRFDAATGELQHRTVIATEVPAAHPHILRNGDSLFLVWKTTEGGSTKVLWRLSEDAGSTWKDGGVAATTRGASDHPFLLGRGGETFLSWHTAAEGWRLVQLAHRP